MIFLKILIKRGEKMAERNFTTNFGANTSGFNQGVEQMKAKLTELNKALLDNQAQIKAVNKEIKDYEKEQAKLKQAIDSGNATEEEKRRYEELTGLIEQARLKVAQYRTEQQTLKSEMANVTAEMRNQGKAAEENGDGFTVLKGIIADMASNVLQSAIDKFGELMTSGKQALNSIQAQTGMTKTEISEMKEQMYDLYSQNYGDSLEDVANVIAAVKQNVNETDPTKIEDIAKNAIAMSDTFGSDVNETLRGVNALITHMGLSAEEAFDYIAKGSQNGLDKTGELSDNIAEYAQIWGQAGFSAEQMFGILQNGLDSGAYNLDKVNDFVKEFTISLSDGRIKESLDSFSQGTKDIFYAWQDGKATQADVFQSVISDLSNMTNQQEALALASNTWSALGEDNAMAVITALNNANDAYKDVSGTMQGINDIKYDDVGSQLETLKRKFEVDLLQPIVEGVTPTLENIINFATDNLPLVAAAFTSITTAVLGYKAAVSMEGVLNTVKNAFSGLIVKIKGSAAASAEDATAKTVEAGATQGAKVAQDGLNASMNANPILLVVSAIAALAVGIGTYIATAQQATEKTSEFEKALESTNDTAKETISKAEAQAKTVNDLGNRYDELRKKTQLNASEQKELDGIASQLAKTLGVTTESLKDQTGAYRDLSGEVENYTQKILDNAKIQAYQEQIVEINKQLNDSKELYDALTTGKNIDNLSIDAQEQLKNILETSDEFDRSGTLEKFIKQHDEWGLKVKDLSKTVADLISGASKSTATAEDFADALRTMGLDEQASQLENLAREFEKTGKSSSSGASANDEYAQSLNTSIKSIEEMKSQLVSYNTELDNNQKAIDETQKSLDKYNQIKQEAIKNGGEDENTNENLRLANDYIGTLTSKLNGLKTQQTEIKNNITETEKAVKSLEDNITNALDTVQDSYTQWQNVIKEVNNENNKTGTISIKTLASIQKKYPELIDLVNEYIAGVKNESDVIAALEEVYNDDVKNYKNAVKTKLESSENFYQTLLDNNANLVNDYKDKYGIDLNNYKTAEEAKLAIKAQAEEQKRQEIANTARLEAQQKWANMTNDPLFGDIYRNYINDAGVWSTYSPNAKKQIEQAGQNAVNAFNQSFNNLYNNFFSAYSDNAIKGLMDNGTGGSSGKNSSNSTKWTTSNGDGIVGTGSTRAESHLDWIEKEKALGRLSTEREIKELKKIKQYRENSADDRYKIELKLYQAEQELAEEKEKAEKERLDRQKEQYSLASEAYNKLVNDKINALNEEKQAAKDAADAEIAAIDRQIEARKRLNEDTDRKAEIDKINAQLAYDSQLDSLSRRELERKKQDLLNEQAQIDWERKMADKKSSITDSLNASNAKTDKAMEALKAAADSAKNYFDKLSGSQSNAQIVNNNSDTRNIKIIQNALSNNQMVDKLLKAIYSK